MARQSTVMTDLVCVRESRSAQRSIWSLKNCQVLEVPSLRKTSHSFRPIESMRQEEGPERELPSRLGRSGAEHRMYQTFLKSV